ncbi:hypothetical protein [Paludisphaera rhizosphaerae]|uniref:hypothetical protein n=2 Tax=Paludisphaera rhizosphaerae TaxID=2711216 RepID=UPI0013EB3461|nr:hypothetical protein [Paludisphaera rhizosphaerae]
MLLLFAGCERPSQPTPSSPQFVATGQPMQVTVFAIKATPNASAIDPRLSEVRDQLRKVLPNHGFELIATRSERLQPGETLPCDLGEDRVAETTYESAEAGRISFLCSFREGPSDAPAYTTHVDAPENQLFFYERSLRDGSRVLIGVGAR